ncbi:unnamed protein product [Closterium sp. NIES-53]
MHQTSRPRTLTQRRLRVKRLPGSPPIFKARYMARGFSQRQGVDFFQTFSPTPKMTTLWVLLHWSLRRPVYSLRQAPREWQDTLTTTLAALGFAPSTTDPSLFLRTDTTLPPFYVLVYDNGLVFVTADAEALALVMSQLQKRHTCTDLGSSGLQLPVLVAIALSSAYQSLALSSTFGRVQHLEAAKRVLRYLCSASGMGLVLGGRGQVVLTGHADASWVDDLAMQRSSQGYTFSLSSGSVPWWSIRSSSVLSSSCEAEIYVGAMAAQELRWLTYLLTVGERPRSSSNLTKHIALRYFLARELQQRGQLHLAYVATRANTADIFSKALQFGDHQPRVSGQGHERYFLLVVDDYTRYTTVFPLRSKSEVFAVLIPWIRTVRLQLRERFGQDLPVLCLHSNRGGEFSSDLLRDFCRGEGILQSFTLLDSPQKNGIAERRIGLVMEVARTSMIHAAAPHFERPFAVRYAVHQLNLWPRVSLVETSPTLRWTGKVGDASVFWVWGSRAFVRDTSADKLSARAIPCIFPGFVPDAPGWQFYHPTSRRVLPSQDVTFDESVPFYRLFPYRSAPSPPPPLFLAPGPPPVDPLPPQGPAPSGVAQVDPLPGTAPVQVAVVSGAALGAASGGAEPRGAGSEGAGSGGAEPEGVEPGGAESEGAEPGGAESESADSGGAEPRGAASSEGPAGASPRLSSQQLREWLVPFSHRRSGAPGAGEPGDTGAGGAAVTTRGGDPTEPGAAGAGGARAGVAGVGGPGAGGAGAAGAGAIDPGAGGAGGTVRPRPYFVPLLQQVFGVPSSTGLPPPFLCPPPDQTQPPLQPPSPLPVPSPYTEQSGGLTERREPASYPFSPVRTARRAPRSRPPPVPGTYTMALRPSSVPLRVPLPAPPESSLPEAPDPESDRARTASRIVSRLLATAVTDLSFESAAASALVAALLDFAVACRLDYTTALEEFECLATAVPRFASMLLAPEGDLDAPDIPTPHSYAEATMGPYSSLWQAAMDAEMASWKSTGTYANKVPPPGVNIVDGMWIFRCDDELHSLDFSTAFLQGSLHEEIWLRQPSGFTGSFPAGTQWSLRRPVYGLCQAPREWHDTLRTKLAALGFVPSTADTTLFLRTDTSLPPFYVLVYVDDLVFATADTEALSLVKSELQKRHTCADLGELCSYLGLQITWDRARRTITVTQSHMVHQSVEPSGPYPELVGCLMCLLTCTRPDLAYPLSLLARYVAPGRHQKVHWDAAKRVLRYLCCTSGMGLVLGGRGPVVITGHADASWVDDSATQRSSQGYTFSLGSGSVSWRSTRSSSVLSSSCEAEIYAGAMASQELCWLT